MTACKLCSTTTPPYKDSKEDPMQTTVHPVDEKLPLGRVTALGLQHVLVMYAGAVAVPLIVGRALNLPPEQVAMLISADLFVCGLVTLIQAMGCTQWFGIKLPVMMGVTFAAVGPMVSMAQSTGGHAGAGGCSLEAATAQEKIDHILTIMKQNQKEEAK